MNGEDSHQQSDSDQFTTLGASGPSASGPAGSTTTAEILNDLLAATSSTRPDPVQPEDSWPDPPPIDDVIGLEDLYTRTAEVPGVTPSPLQPAPPTGGRPHADAPSPPSGPSLGPIADLLFDPRLDSDSEPETEIDLPGPEPDREPDDVAVGFSPTRIQPVDEPDGRLPSPFDLGVDLKFSVEPGRGERPAWSFDDGVDRPDHVGPVHYAPAFKVAPPPPAAPSRVRSPGERRQQSTVFQLIYDLADRRWFWASVAGVAVGVAGLALIVNDLVAGSTDPAGIPDVVADDTNVSGTIQPAAPTTDGAGAGAEDSASSSRYGNAGTPTEGAGPDAESDPTVAPSSDGTRRQTTTTAPTTTSTPTSAETTTETTTTETTTTTAEPTTTGASTTESSTSTTEASTSSTEASTTTTTEESTSTTEESTSTTSSTTTTAPDDPGDGSGGGGGAGRSRFDGPSGRR